MRSGTRAGTGTASTNPLLPLLDPELRANPYPLLKELRERGPLEAENGAVVIFGDYASCSSILRDREMGSDPSRSPLVGEFLRAGEIPVNASIFFMDPPSHSRQRKLVSTLFTPRTIAEAEPTVRAAVDSIFRSIEENGQVDVPRELSFPLAHRVSCDLFGIPRDERTVLSGLADGIAKSTELPTTGAGIGVSRLYSRDDLESIAKSAFSSHAYFADLAHRRRRNPGDDIVSKLVAGAGESAGLSRFELSFGLLTVFSASYESTTNLISNGILALLRHPEQLAIVRENPSLMPSVVDEVLRYDAPAQLVSRVPLTAKRIGDVEVTPNQAIIVLLAAANRDPSAYADPDRFDIFRQSDKMSLSFGAGAHFCVGVSLAKLTAELALAAFVERLKDVELIEESISYKRKVAVRGMERMVIRFNRR